MLAKGQRRGPYEWKPKGCVICKKTFQTTGPHQNYCSLECRFQDFPIDKTNPNGCWVWTGPLNIKGYGLGAWEGETQPAHRLSWKVFFGHIPKGLFVCHSCHNPSCVNPNHLYLATNNKNMHDSKILCRYAKKLTASDVRIIKKLFETSNLSRRKIAKMFHVNRGSIDRIYHGSAWTHIH